jgi:hypothetical protein
MRKIAVSLLTLVVAACTNGGADSTSSPDMTTSTTTTGPTSTLPPVIECPGVGDFEEGGGIAEIPGEGSDSRSLGRISWETNDQCETFHIDFETSEGAPATTVPAIRVDHLESFQVVRIDLDVDGTLVTDQLVETGLVDRLYVVRALSGDMFVDLHLAEPAAVRVQVFSSPARLSLELRPGVVPFAGRSTLGQDIVLTSPPGGADVDPNVQLIGYARTFEANVLAVVTQGGDVVTEATTTAADSAFTWGEYRLALTLPPGAVTVFLGDESPEDGSLEGITVDLTAS